MSPGPESAEYHPGVAIRKGRAWLVPVGMAGWSTTRTADQEVHEVAEATNPGGTAMFFVAPGAAYASGAF